VQKTWIVGITGASGSPYAFPVIKGLLVEGAKVHIIISEPAFAIIRDETGHDLAGESEADVQSALSGLLASDRVDFHFDSNMYAPVSSGSYKTDGMIIVPCSMKTLSAVASGYADTLITRAADVCLKEGRRLVISPREMPLGALHLENMLKLARLGARIAPPMPAFYHKPELLDDMIDFVAGKILDAAGVPNSLYSRWGKGEKG